ncbi:hypothetical protein [Polynucleobacter asymbioticus]|uniref:Uncharacterized protein n=1 Tax=Polynucleobacter asymbioticus (strain DSM 18221 / CIP 109841 / QLW-P1DMWA-1) TaxID=312153 RepID=A4SXY1_POLAQ|nr:hypothetical protein [Polynucleobacter asymbioticus]ABP34345.1 conserved hypothetical protein [Polynucleobacter asymbioticus QLW-P1DMWA-1]
MIENNQKKSKKPALSKSKGGARPGAGRKEGSLTKRTREIAEVAAAQGITPLEVMMSTMMALYKEAGNCSRESNQHHDQGDKANQYDDGHTAMITENRIKLLNMAATIARHAAPYVHPRLSAIEHTGKDGTPLQSGVLVVPSAMSMDEWEQAAQAKH